MQFVRGLDKGRPFLTLFETNETEKKIELERRDRVSAE